MARQKTLLIIAVLVVVMGAFYLWFRPDGKLHVVFCDVGQGDGILIIKGDKQLLIDGGPDEKVLGCLARHVPFYDRHIEMLLMTHPQSDHMNGLIYTLQRYRVQYFFANPEGNNTSAYHMLEKELVTNGLRKTSLFTGNKITFSGVQFQSIWPSQDLLYEHMNDGTDLNGFGIVGILSYGTFDVMLTADADVPVEPRELSTGLVRRVEVLKVPHHGSKTGMLPEWLDVVSPHVAVISSGKKNKYGHPASEAIQLLKDRNVQVVRTDQVGDIEIVSDGRQWWVVQ